MICLRRVFVTEQKPYKEQRMYKNQSSLIYVFLFLFLGVGVGGGTLICPMYCLVAPNLLTLNVCITNPTKNGGELVCSRRVSNSCSTSSTHRVPLVTNLVIS